MLINKLYIASAYFSDYSAGSYRVTFPAGNTTASIRMYIRDDNDVELTNETFLLVINDLLLPKQIASGDIKRTTVAIVSNDGKCVVIYVVNSNYCKVEFYSEANLMYVPKFMKEQ